MRCVAGHEIRIACGAANLSCEATPGSHTVGDCERPAPARGDECNSATEPWCANGRIRYCFAGEMRSFDCALAGFSNCLKEGDSVRCQK